MEQIGTQHICIIIHTHAVFKETQQLAKLGHGFENNQAIEPSNESLGVKGPGQAL